MKFHDHDDLQVFHDNDDLPGFHDHDDLPGFHDHDDLPGFHDHDDLPGVKREFSNFVDLPSQRIQVDKMITLAHPSQYV